MAFNTPFKMWKRYEFNGGTSDPCIVSWPAGMKSKGEIRHQYHHAIDLVPTVLDVLGVEPPDVDQGSRPELASTASACATASTTRGCRRRRPTQFYAMLGSRAIWHDGWKAVTNHPTVAGWSNFNDDEWELYHTEVDRSELHNLAAEMPEKVRELQNLWFAEAGANGAFPLDDRSALEILLTPRPVLSPARNRYVYFPDTAEVPESQAVNVRNRSFGIGALVDIPAPGAEGVLFAHGSAFGGHALYVKDEQAPLRLQLRRHGASSSSWRARTSPTGEKLILAASFDKDAEDPPGVANGTLSLWHDDKKVGEGRIKTQPGKFMIAGRGALHRARRRLRGDDRLPGDRAVALHGRHDQAGSPSTSAASRTWTSSARPRRC